MKFKIPNWKTISLSVIAIVSFAPYFGIVFFKATHPNISFVTPSKTLYSNECTFVTNTPCSKGFVFSISDFDKTKSFVPGFTTSIPRLMCADNKQEIGLTAETNIGMSVLISQEKLACKNELIAYFRTDLDAASGSWILPMAIQGTKSELSYLNRSVNFFRFELRSIIAGVVPVQVIFLYFFLILLGASAVERYRYSFLVVSIMAIVNGGILEKALFLPNELFSPEVKEFLGILLLLTFSIESLKKCVRFTSFFSYFGFAIVLETGKRKLEYSKGNRLEFYCGLLGSFGDQK